MPACVSPTGMPVARTKVRKRIGGFGVEDAAARHDQGSARRPDPLGRPRKDLGLGPRPAHAPHPLLEERFRILEGLALHVLGQGQGHGAGVGRAREDAHRFEKGGHELLGTVDAVPVAGDRLEAVVDRNVLGPSRLELLEHGGHLPRGKDVPGEQEHREPVDGAEGRPRDHVGGAGPDGAGAGVGLQAVRHLGVARGHVDHGLLVARGDVAQAVPHLLEGLTHPSHVAVSEDPQHPCEEPAFGPVALSPLVGEELDERLGHGQPAGLHASRPFRKSRLRAASSEGPAPLGGMSSRTRSCSMTYQPSYPPPSRRRTISAMRAEPFPRGV